MSVRCNLGFNVDRLVLGSFMQAKDVPVSVTVNKILMLLPEDPMRPRLADSRIGVNAINRIARCVPGYKNLLYYQALAD